MSQQWVCLTEATADLLAAAAERAKMTPSELAEDIVHAGLTPYEDL
jgi:hypothetical protein